MRRETEMEDDGMRTEYELKNGRRNPYADRLKSGTNLVLIEPDLYPYFPTSEAVNAALRLLVKVSAKAVKPRATKQTKAS